VQSLCLPAVQRPLGQRWTVKWRGGVTIFERRPSNGPPDRLGDRRLSKVSRRLALSALAVAVAASLIVACNWPASEAPPAIPAHRSAEGIAELRPDQEPASSAESAAPEALAPPPTRDARQPTVTAETPEAGPADVGPNPEGTLAPVVSSHMRTVAVDPGHGGAEVGAVFAEGGQSLAEKDVNLSIALRLKSLLENAGHRVVLTRDSDRSANNPPVDRTGDGRVNSRDDLQARVDIANEAGADVFISLHNNGSGSPDESGTEVWYCKERTFGDKNFALASELQSAILASLRSVGYTSRDRGIKEDSNFRIYRGQPYNIFVLGPAREPGHPRATEMPGALIESLFVSNPVEARLLQRDDVLDAIAAGCFEGIERYFAIK